MQYLKNTLIICLFAVGIVGSAELFLRLMTSVVNVYDVEMIKYAKELKIPSPYLEISHVHKPNSSADLMGVNVSFNSLGHRSAELGSTKKKSEVRIHVIGSSIAMGWGVEAEQTFISVAKSRLNNELGQKYGKKFIEINAGVGNYNAVYSIELFKRQLEITDPDIVVFQYYINDAEPNPVGTNSPLTKHSLLYAFLSARIQQMMFVSSSKSLAGYYENLYAEDTPGWKSARQAISELAQICRDRKIQLVALMIPEMHNLSEDGPYPRIYNIVESLFSNMGVPFISSYSSLSTAFAGNPKAAWIATDDPHPSAESHKIIADTLYDHLVTTLQ